MRPLAGPRIDDRRHPVPAVPALIQMFRDGQDPVGAAGAGHVVFDLLMRQMLAETAITLNHSGKMKIANLMTLMRDIDHIHAEMTPR